MRSLNTVKNMMIAEAQMKGGRPAKSVHTNNWNDCFFVTDEGLLVLSYDFILDGNPSNGSICAYLSEESKEMYGELMDERGISK